MYYNPFSLEGKTVLITGASSGIGKTIAVECSKMGAKLIITGRDVIKLKTTFDLLNNCGHLSIVADLTNKSELELLIEQLPYLDGVVHCAAILKKLPLKFITESAWEETIKSNLFAPALLSQRLVKKNKINNSSSIVFISSIASNVASFGNITYMASKGAINSLSRGMALELATKKIRVNTVEPALIKTNLTNNALTEEELNNYLQKFPLGRFGKPEEVAYAVIYLLSDASLWVTGSSIRIDGGVTLRS
jgi:NAD(P)-dependent dehydrogenase (short-subunit alcohol dehydrogenase family)